MSNSSTVTVPRPPDVWRDSLHPLTASGVVHDKEGRSLTSVAAALEALGEDVPTAWQKAREKFRVAEWLLTCRTGLNTLQQNADLAAAGLADAQQRLAMKPTSLEMMEFVANCTAIADVAGSIYAAALATMNGNNPLTIAAERKQRASLLQQARERHNLHQTRREPTPQEEIDRLADLLDTCAADERAAEAEQEEIAALQAAADSAKEKALDTLCDALDKAICADARKIVATLTPRQIAIAAEYPELVDPKTLVIFQHAGHLAQISAALDGQGVDLDQTIGRALSPEQHTALSRILFKATRHLFGETRGRQRGRRTE